MKDLGDQPDAGAKHDAAKQCQGPAQKGIVRVGHKCSKVKEGQRNNNQAYFSPFGYQLPVCGKEEDNACPQQNGPQQQQDRDQPVLVVSGVKAGDLICLIRCDDPAAHPTFCFS